MQLKDAHFTLSQEHAALQREYSLQQADNTSLQQHLKEQTESTQTALELEEKAFAVVQELVSAVDVLMKEHKALATASLNIAAATGDIETCLKQEKLPPNLVFQGFHTPLSPKQSVIPTLPVYSSDGMRSMYLSRLQITLRTLKDTATGCSNTCFIVSHQGDLLIAAKDLIKTSNAFLSVQNEHELLKDLHVSLTNTKNKLSTDLESVRKKLQNTQNELESSQEEVQEQEQEQEKSVLRQEQLRLRAVEDKYKALEPKFLQLVDHYKRLANEKRRMENELAEANKRIGELKKKEAIMKQAEMRLEGIEKELADKEAHVQYLMQEKLQVQQVMNDMATGDAFGRRGSSAGVAPGSTGNNIGFLGGSGIQGDVLQVVATQIQVLYDLLQHTINLHSQQVKIGEIKDEHGTRQIIIESLQSLRESITYSKAGDLMEEEKEMFLQLLDQMLSMPSQLVQICSMSDLVLELRDEIKTVRKEVETVKLFCSKERMRLTKQHEEEAQHFRRLINQYKEEIMAKR
jgi:hypothetical protein